MEHTRKLAVLRMAVMVAALVTAGALGGALISPAYASRPVASRPKSRSLADDAKRLASLAQFRRQKDGADDNSRGTATQRAVPSRRRASAVRVYLWRYPLEIWGLAWALLVLIVELSAPRVNGARTGTYAFGLTTLALAGVLWGLYQVSFIPRLIALDHAIGMVAVAFVFIVGAMTTPPSFRDLLAHLPRDMVSVVRGAPLWAALAVFVIVVSKSSNTPASTRPEIPTGAQFERWYASQPRVEVPLESAEAGKALVTIVKFNDYQCPPCKSAHFAYKDIIRRATAQNPGGIRFVSLDYPLETECNPYTAGDLHTSACEAAAAIRMVSDDEHRQRLADWFWTNQPSLNGDVIAAAAKTIGGVADFADEYPRLLSGIRKDVEIGKALGVSGTPTYFVNGVRLPAIPPEDFETAIKYELRQAGTVANSGSSLK